MVDKVVYTRNKREIQCVHEKGICLKRSKFSLHSWSSYLYCKLLIHIILMSQHRYNGKHRQNHEIQSHDLVIEEPEPTHDILIGLKQRLISQHINIECDTFVSIIIIHT